MRKRINQIAGTALAHLLEGVPANTPFAEANEACLPIAKLAPELLAKRVGELTPHLPPPNKVVGEAIPFLTSLAHDKPRPGLGFALALFCVGASDYLAERGVIAPVGGTLATEIRTWLSNAPAAVNAHPDAVACFMWATLPLAYSFIVEMQGLEFTQEQEERGFAAAVVGENITEGDAILAGMLASINDKARLLSEGVPAASLAVALALDGADGDHIGARLGIANRLIEAMAFRKPFVSDN